MQSNIVTSITDKAINYDEAEQQFINLLDLEDLDKQLEKQPALADEFETALVAAIDRAYNPNSGDEAAHLFLQRIPATN